MTPWTVACQASLSFTISQSLFKLTSIKSVMPTNCLSLIPLSSCPQFFPVSGSFPMSWLFASGGQKCWNFSFSINPSNEHSGLIFFRMDWLYLFLQFKELSRVFSITTVTSTSSSVLSFLYHPTLTAIHDYWKKHSFD